MRRKRAADVGVERGRIARVLGFASLLLRRLAGIRGHPVLDEELGQVEVAKALGALGDSEGQLGGAEVTVCSLVDQRFEGQLAVSRLLGFAAGPIFYGRLEYVLDGLGPGVGPTPWTPFRVAGEARLESSVYGGLAIADFIVRHRHSSASYLQMLGCIRSRRI